MRIIFSHFSLKISFTFPIILSSRNNFEETLKTFISFSLESDVTPIFSTIYLPLKLGRKDNFETGIISFIVSKKSQRLEI
jgi:hypothetical protein